VTVDFAHLRSTANAGTGQKPHDLFGVGLCREHHVEQHSLGIAAFDRKYGTDLWALAAEFAQRTPDIDMRAAIKGGGFTWTTEPELPQRELIVAP
jgi:hypothetical protein